MAGGWECTQGSPVDTCPEFILLQAPLLANAGKGMLSLKNILPGTEQPVFTGYTMFKLASSTKVRNWPIPTICLFHK